MNINSLESDQSTDDELNLNANDFLHSTDIELDSEDSDESNGSIYSELELDHSDFVNAYAMELSDEDNIPEEDWRDNDTYAGGDDVIQPSINQLYFTVMLVLDRPWEDKYICESIATLNLIQMTNAPILMYEKIMSIFQHKGPYNTRYLAEQLLDNLTAINVVVSFQLNSIELRLLY